MDLQFAIDDMPTTATGFLMRVFPWHRWSKRSRVPSSCCQCQDASSSISWFSIVQCDFAPFGVGPSQSVPGDTACRSFWWNSALVSQTVTTLAGKSYQRMSERERERSNRKSTTIATSGLVFEICAALLWGQEPLLSLSSCFFEKFTGIVARKFSKKNSLRLNRYVLISDCLWFRYWGNTNMTTARRTSSPTGGCLLHHFTS